MPDYVVSKLMDALNQQGKALNGSHILMLGIAYKKNVGDMRESPAAMIMEKSAIKAVLPAIATRTYRTSPPCVTTNLTLHRNP